MFLERKATIEKTKKILSQKFIKAEPGVQSKLAALGSPPLASAQSALQILRRPELSLKEVVSLAPDMNVVLDPQTEETLEVEVKYEGYINMQRQEIERLARMQGMSIPETLEYEAVEGLSKEIREKLKKNRPKTLADASRISGVTPAAMTAILFHLRQKEMLSVVH
jgi:tRNA uridine 5-carboxymethylaminomethyl modification enzyme